MRLNTRGGSCRGSTTCLLVSEALLILLNGSSVLMYYKQLNILISITSILIIPSLHIYYSFSSQFFCGLKMTVALTLVSEYSGTSEQGTLWG